MSENQPRRRSLSSLTDPEGKPRWQRRQEKIREEIARNRRGEYKVPTWVLAAILVLIVGGFAALLIFVR
jgi:hypothetical protein